MRKVLNVLTVPMARNGMALLLSRLARETGGIFLACFGSVPDSMADDFRFSRLYFLPDRRSKPTLWARSLARIVRKEGFSAVHIHGNSATMALDLLAAKRGGAKRLIAQGHNTGAVYQKADKLLRPLFYRLTDVPCACSDEAGRFLYAGRPFTLLPVPVEEKKYAFDPERRRAAREKYGAESGTCLIGNAASLAPEKNQAALIRALTGMEKSYRLLIAGDGPERESLAALAEELGVKDRVTFAGQLADLTDFYAAIDVFALPSRREGLPTVVLEAICAGLPCIVSENVTRECDIVPGVTHADEEHLALAISRAYRGAEDRASASRAGLAAIDATGHSLARAAEAYSRVWDGEM